MRSCVLAASHLSIAMPPLGALVLATADRMGISNGNIGDFVNRGCLPNERQLHIRPYDPTTTASWDIVEEHQRPDTRDGPCLSGVIPPSLIQA